MSRRHSSRVIKFPQRFRDNFETQEDCNEEPTFWEESEVKPFSRMREGRGRSQRENSSDDAEGDVDAVRDRSRSPNHLRIKTEEEQDDEVSQPPHFTPKRTPGIQPPLNKGNPQPVEFFSHFFDAATLKLLCESTNKNAVKNKQKGKMFAWEDIGPEEMMKFLGMLLYMGILHLPKLSDYWRRGTIFQVAFPGTVMTRDRFMTVLTNLDMSDPDEGERKDRKRGTDKYDSLHQVRPLVEMIRLNCKSMYHPRQHLAVDERMVGNKARTGFNQYMKEKPTEWRLKFYVISDLNGYIIDFNLYTGKSFDVLNDLFNEDDLGSGYVVHINDSHTCPPSHPGHSGDTLRWQKTEDSRNVSEYNKYMEEVDTSDQMIETYTLHRKKMRWSTNVFQHLIDIAVGNSYILHKDRCASMQTKPMTRQQFQEELAAQLLGVSLRTDTPKTSGWKHLPIPTSSVQKPKTLRASLGRRRCKVCKKSTAWKCEECDVGLCLQLERNCFWQYHQD